MGPGSLISLSAYFPDNLPDITSIRTENVLTCIIHKSFWYSSNYEAGEGIENGFIF